MSCRPGPRASPTRPLASAEREQYPNGWDVVFRDTGCPPINFHDRAILSLAPAIRCDVSYIVLKVVALEHIERRAKLNEQVAITRTRPLQPACLLCQLPRAPRQTPPLSPRCNSSPKAGQKSLQGERAILPVNDCRECWSPSPLATGAASQLPIGISGLRGPQRLATTRLPLQQVLPIVDMAVAERNDRIPSVFPVPPCFKYPVVQ
jgi:hypothetical protein